MKPFSLLLVALALLPCAALCAADETVDPGMPNIVLIVTDYMGATDIGPYGATDIATPALDQLAQQGMRYTNFYAAAPICGPSRAALMSGQYPARVDFEQNIGDGNDGLNARIPTLPALLKQRGYATGLFGKWHLGHDQDRDPIAHGFDEFLGYHNWSIHPYTHRNDSDREALTQGREVIERDGYLLDVITDDSVRFMEAHRDEPFFAYVAYNTTLPPFLGPDLPEARWDAPFDNSHATREDYIAMVEAMDAGVGRLMDSLASLGLADNTLLIFTYDHNGRHLVRNAPFSGGFATVREGGLRVPLILRWPDRVEADATAHTPAIGMDITATALSAAGIDTADLHLDGVDLLAAGEPGDPRTFFWRIQLGDYGQAAVRRGKWKLLVDRYVTFVRPSVYLYDLENDPGESRDQYHAQQALADQLYAELVAWEATMDDPGNGP
jgi:arylsulfatase A-like enzyme